MHPRGLNILTINTTVNSKQRFSSQSMRLHYDECSYTFYAALDIPLYIISKFFPMIDDG